MSILLIVVSFILSLSINFNKQKSTKAKYKDTISDNRIERVSVLIVVNFFCFILLLFLSENCIYITISFFFWLVRVHRLVLLNENLNSFFFFVEYFYFIIMAGLITYYNKFPSSTIYIFFFLLQSSLQKSTVSYK